MTLRNSLPLAVVLLGLSACGLKGPLYLPDPGAASNGKQKPGAVSSSTDTKKK